VSAQSSSGSERDRALSALQGLAIGDALGMPYQLLPRAEIVALIGEPIVSGFRAASAEHPIAAGLPAGSITDDTEQALLVAQLLIEGDGSIAPTALAAALVRWEENMRRRGSHDLLGPSTTRAVQAVLRGEPVETAGRFGTTNGAAMRVTPVGIATPVTDLERLVTAVADSCSVTHSTSLALAAASAVAAAVSAGIAGADIAEATRVAIDAAALARDRGHFVAGGDVAARIAWAVELAQTHAADPVGALDRIALLVGTSLAAQESVPAAFAVLALHADDPWQAVRAAASLGGDADTIAAIAGAIAGAVHGVVAWPADAVATVERVNDLDLGSAVDALLALRHRASSG
jgi:ADP-ribosylglycohydrolase